MRTLSLVALVAVATAMPASGQRGGGPIRTTDLPPSEVAEPRLPVEIVETEEPRSEFEPKPADPADPAEAAWTARQEERRAAVNEIEGPLVDKLNAEVAARHAEIRRRNEAAAEEGRRAREEHREALRRAEAEERAAMERHRIALERHRREVERQRREYEERVAACRAGVRAACGRR